MSSYRIRINFLIFWVFFFTWISFSPSTLSKNGACDNGYRVWFLPAFPSIFLVSPRYLFLTVFINCLQSISTDLPSQRDLRALTQPPLCTGKIYPGLSSPICVRSFGSCISSTVLKLKQKLWFIQHTLIISSLLILFCFSFPGGKQSLRDILCSNLRASLFQITWRSHTESGWVCLVGEELLVFFQVFANFILHPWLFKCDYHLINTNVSQLSYQLINNIFSFHVTPPNFSRQSEFHNIIRAPIPTKEKAHATVLFCTSFCTYKSACPGVET